LAVFGQIGLLCRFGIFKDDFGRFLGTGRFLDTVFLLFHAFRFAVSDYSRYRKTKSFEKLINGVSFILFIYKIFESAFGCFERCIHLVFGSF